MINLINQYIGRSYEVLTYPDGTPISGVAGLDIEWITCAVIYCFFAFALIKLFCRIFIGK